MPANTKTDLRNGVNGDVGCKYPCLVASMVNITLEEEKTINGVAVVENDIVLVNAQDDPTENGVYVVSTGEWQRAVWFNNQLNVSPGSLVYTYSGTQRFNTIWVTRCADNPIDFGTSTITFDFVVAAGSGFLLASNNLSDVVSASDTRVNLGLEIGTDVQAQNNNLQSISGLILAANKIIGGSSLGTAVLYTIGEASGNIPLIGTQSASISLAGLTQLADTNTTIEGTSTSTAVTPAGLAGKFKRFISLEQEITIGGNLTIPHGLGAMPTLINTKLICKVADQGYSIGDVIDPFLVQSNPSGSFGSITTLDTTNLFVKYCAFSPVYYIINKTTGNFVPITIASWRVIFTAWII